jgi:B12-binding domain/radical SAM domain protein
MKTNSLVFIATKENRNSIAALTGVLEIHPRLDDLPLYFVEEAQAPTRVPELATRSDHLVVAFSFATFGLPRTAHLVRQLRPLPNVTLIAGGPHPSGDPDGTLRLGMDAVVVGEGEIALPALLERVFADQSYADLPGTATLRRAQDAALQNGELVLNHRPPRADLNDYPPFGLRHRRIAHIELSRGCPYGCTFCQTPRFLGGKMRHRTVERVVHWIKQARKGGLRYVRFVTPNAFAYGSPDGKTLNVEAVEHLLSEVSQLLGREQVYFGSFPSDVRPEHVTEETAALIKRYCGNRHLVLGAQTGSPRLLATLHRGHTVDDVYRATEITVRAGLTPYVYFIFGLPGETEEDRRLTVQAIKDFTDMRAVIRSGVFIPLPGTPLASAPPGQVAPGLHSFLGQMAERGLQFGRWPVWAAQMAATAS